MCVYNMHKCAYMYKCVYMYMYMCMAHKVGTHTVTQRAKKKV